MHTATLVKMGAQAHMLATYQAQMHTNKDDHLHIIRQTDMWLPKCSRTCTKTKKSKHIHKYVQMHKNTQVHNIHSPLTVVR